MSPYATLNKFHLRIAETNIHSPGPESLTYCLDALSEVVTLVGQDGFLSALARLCEAASGYDSTFITAYFDSHSPVELFDNLDDEFSDATIGPYLDFAYLLDPFYNLIRNGRHDGVVTLKDCAPDDFLTSEYYETFYVGTGLFDEANVIVPFGEGTFLSLSLGSRDEGFMLSDAAREMLTALFPCISALCKRHWPKFNPESIQGQGRIGLHLEKSFERFSTSVLSQREAEIVRLILKGHSSKSIARELGNSPETVKVHRKRIHNKLGIASQGELFSLFLDALSQTPSNATEDPLTYLDRQVSEYD
ncbi:Transcriptional regulatory protein TdiR [Roseovarius albus]|uniref:Transcriptional regulatory protein TdiR n=1 Tax=Roseovarius albus TaxID=1247867 RepID=A0A1X7A4B9_9RHOB|nr:LuxR C-terminal-related transcriptional regulator [Roseovarius albus]SLN69826.1 Transcriptional regulatory protein TdiR [Roseovarius albus]